MSKVPSIEQMLKAGMHFGHRTSKWHPKCASYIFTARNGVYIIDLMKAQKMLETALDFMQKFAAEGKVILFVGTKSQVKKPLKNLAKEINMPYVSEKWLGGCLTNFSIIRRMIRNYQDLLKDKSLGKLEKYTKKERLDFDREINRLELKVGGLVDLNRLPDAIFIWDIKQEEIAVKEAIKKNIPIIAVCDTNVNPTNINYVIPANDDATKTVKLIFSAIKDSIEDGKKAKIN